MDAPVGFHQATPDDLRVGRHFRKLSANGRVVQKGEIRGIGNGHISTVEAGSALCSYHFNEFLYPDESINQIFIQDVYPTDVRKVEYIYLRYDPDGGYEYSLDRQNIEDVLLRHGRLAFAYSTYVRYEAEVNGVHMRSDPQEVKPDDRSNRSLQRRRIFFVCLHHTDLTPWVLSSPQYRLIGEEILSFSSREKR